MYKLLYATPVEARSCERFRLLSEKLKDKRLARFYKKMMISEANHYTMFLQFARTYGGREQTDQKWKALLEFEEQSKALARLCMGDGGKDLGQP